ncbi:hypothetical protein PIROE2DRAFT_62769 [Piromyces sp. E2]|nr:hypothetical protein PIROE2DRAFT_62769 [Piromyces sp. E2]|eukprot:OUM61030.1 hypothetical protein PIROE2DRAFT_62769 [Piromyces sp. E2]
MSRSKRTTIEDNIIGNSVVKKSPNNAHNNNIQSVSPNVILKNNLCRISSNMVQNNKMVSNNDIKNIVIQNSNITNIMVPNNNTQQNLFVRLPNNKLQQISPNIIINNGHQQNSHTCLPNNNFQDIIGQNNNNQQISYNKATINNLQQIISNMAIKNEIQQSSYNKAAINNLQQIVSNMAIKNDFQQISSVMIPNNSFQQNSSNIIQNKEHTQVSPNMIPHNKITKSKIISNNELFQNKPNITSNNKPLQNVSHKASDNKHPSEASNITPNIAQNENHLQSLSNNIKYSNVSSQILKNNNINQISSIMMSYNNPQPVSPNNIIQNNNQQQVITNSSNINQQSNNKFNNNNNLNGYNQNYHIQFASLQNQPSKILMINNANIPSQNNSISNVINSNQLERNNESLNMRDDDNNTNRNKNESKQNVVNKPKHMENNNSNLNIVNNKNMSKNESYQNSTTSNKNQKNNNKKEKVPVVKRRTIKKVKTSDILLTKISTSKIIIKRKKLRERTNVKLENANVTNDKEIKSLSAKQSINDKTSSKLDEQSIVDTILKTKKPRQNMIYLTEKILKHLNEYTELIVNDLFDSLYIFNDRAKEFHLANLKNFINSYGSVLARKLAKKAPYRNEMIKILIRIVKNKNEILAKSMKRNCITSNDFSFEFSLFLRKKKMEEIRDLFVFPFNGINSVVVTTEDEKRLISGKMFNDNLIEFCIKWLESDVLTKEQKDDVHFFNTFFFEQLYSRRSLSPDKMYESVKKWSKGDIFEKKYIFIPINEAMHWYLIMIYNPSAYLTKDDENKSLNGTKSTPVLINIDKDLNSNDSHFENDNETPVDVDTNGEDTVEESINHNSSSNETFNLSISNIENDPSSSLDNHKNFSDMNNSNDSNSSNFINIINDKGMDRINDDSNSISNKNVENNNENITEKEKTVNNENNIINIKEDSDIESLNVKIIDSSQQKKLEKIEIDKVTLTEINNTYNKNSQDNMSEKMIDINKIDLKDGNNNNKHEIELDDEIQLGTKSRIDNNDVNETILINDRKNKDSKIRKISINDEVTIEEKKENPNIKILLDNAVQVREALNEVNLKYSNNSLERLRTFITKELALKMINFIVSLKYIKILF